jgi:CheY-like chemotaxis protein
MGVSRAPQSNAFAPVPAFDIPEGELYIDGVLVDRITNNPEMSVFDVPAGEVQLSWMVSDYGDGDRNRTTQNALTLTPTDGETVFVLLDWYNDTPAAGFFLGPIGTFATAAFRTEVVRAPNNAQFVDKRVVHYERIGDDICSQSTPATAPTAATLGEIRATSGIATTRGELNEQLLSQCLNYLSSERQCGCFLGRLGQRSDQEMWGLLVSLRLVADDDDLILATCRFVLEDRGYHVLLAENGKEAISQRRCFCDEWRRYNQ